jgi:hypothetical protein
MQNKNKHPSTSSSPDDGFRRFLAVSILIIIVLETVVFLITRDDRVIDLITVIVSSAGRVFGH